MTEAGFEIGYDKAVTFYPESKGIVSVEKIFGDSESKRREEILAASFTLDEIKDLKDRQWFGESLEPSHVLDKSSGNIFPVNINGELWILNLYWVTHWACLLRPATKRDSCCNNHDRVFKKVAPRVPLLLVALSEE